MMKTLKRAWLDTLSWFGGWSAIMPAILWPTFGFGLHLLQAPVPEVQEEWALWVIYGLQAGGVLFAGSFLWNLICTPYRIERDKRIALEASSLNLSESVQGLGKLIKGRDKFTLKEAAYIIANEPISRSEATGVAAGYLSDLERAVMDEKIKTIPPITEIQKVLHLQLMKARLSGLLYGPAIPNLERAEITKEELIRYAKDNLAETPKILTH